ncbi:hypothetical protein F4677DRAFT_459633 [Hypoxylon crocopeplum]|nr:hypothetical protein F4677DRAFT_459633 [Hypoxylon crocopeplum]
MPTPISTQVNQGPERLLQFLAQNVDVRFIRFQWLDYTNMLRCRVLTKTYVEQLAAANRYYAVGVGFLTLLEDEHGNLSLDPTEAVGQSPLIPDWNSLRLCPWAHGHASIQCYFGKYGSGPQQQNQDHLRPDEICPRFALRNSVIQARELGLEIDVGFETEFCVALKQADGSVTAPPLGSHSPSAMHTLEDFMLPVMDEIVACLESAGVSVLVYHAEGQRGQYEVSTSQLPPLEAADALVFTRQVIRNVCKRHSLVPTFHPWTPVTNGAHTNISLRNNGRLNAGTEESFLAGMLEHLSAILAFSLPLPVSYKRVVAGQQAFGRFETWGFQNREVPIRKKGPAFWELRCVDASANIYLALAAIIISGTAGVTEKMRLTVQDCQVDPETLSSESRKKLGIIRELPISLGEAHSSLRMDRVLNGALGSGLIQTYLQLMTEFSNTLNKVGNINSDAQRNFLSTRL